MSGELEQAKVSVIIPVYKTEKYLRECLSSVCQQTYKNLEIIVVNDCSPDGSQDLIEEFARVDPRVIPFKTRVNSGLSVSRNLGMEKASGTYVTFLDSDDSILPENVETLMRVMITYGCDLVMCPLNIYNEATGAYFRDGYHDLAGLAKFEDQGPFPTRALLGYLAVTNVSAHGKLFRLKALRERNLKFPAGLAFEDNPFFWDFVSSAETRFCVISKPLNYYRAVRIGALTSSRDTYKDIFVIFDLLDDVFAKHGLTQVVANDLFRYKVIQFWYWQGGRGGSWPSLDYLRRAQVAFRKIPAEVVINGSKRNQAKVRILNFSVILAFFIFALFRDQRFRSALSDLRRTLSLPLSLLKSAVRR